MLGKRCRTLQRTASISQNMGPHYLHLNHYYHDLAINHAKPNAESIVSSPFQATNPHSPTIIPQIIGFNPIIKNDHGTAQSKAHHPPDHPSTHNISAWPPPHDIHDDDSAHASTHLQQKLAGGTNMIKSAPGPAKRSQATPRSALQTLLAAARQITCTDQPPALSKVDGNIINKPPLIKASAASPSCSTSSISAKQGLWQGFALSDSKPKEISTNQSLIKSAVITAETKLAPEAARAYNAKMSEAGSDQNLFFVEGATKLAPDFSAISLELEQNQHSLYLATSPLTPDLIPNLAASMSFMESCYLCKRPLGLGRDIFMYRGESAFCSMECRDKQMRLEERKETFKGLHFKMNNDNQKEELYNTTTVVSTNGIPYHQHHKAHQYHHHEHNSQACGNKQHRTSLLMPAA